MRELFDQELAAWEQASSSGTSLGSHIAEHTSHTRKLVSPPPAKATRIDDAASQVTIATGRASTHADIVPQFDPIEARRQEILTDLDLDAPPSETPAERARRRADTLLLRAHAWAAVGEPDLAVASIELAIAEAPAVIASQSETILDILSAYVGDPARRPVLARPYEELVELTLPREGTEMLAHIDGELTVGELLGRVGLDRLEAYRQLARLLLRGVIV